VCLSRIERELVAEVLPRVLGRSHGVRIDKPEDIARYAAEILRTRLEAGRLSPVALPARPEGGRPCEDRWSFTGAQLQLIGQAMARFNVPTINRACISAVVWLCDDALERLEALDGPGAGTSLRWYLRRIVRPDDSRAKKIEPSTTLWEAAHADVWMPKTLEMRQQHEATRGRPIRRLTV
jgi:hypothetical protein